MFTAVWSQMSWPDQAGNTVVEFNPSDLNYILISCWSRSGVGYMNDLNPGILVEVCILRISKAKQTNSQWLKTKKKKKLWIEEGEEMLSPRKSIWIGFEKETKKLAYLGRKQLASPMNFNQGTISFRNRLWFLLLIHSVTFQLKCHFPRKGLLACSSHPPS